MAKKKLKVTPGMQKQLAKAINQHMEEMRDENGLRVILASPYVSGMIDTLTDKMEDSPAKEILKDKDGRVVILAKILNAFRFSKIQYTTDEGATSATR